MPLSVGEMDVAFPTIVRYVGMLMMVAASVASGFGLYVEMAPVFLAASGAILYKNVAGAGKAKE